MKQSLHYWRITKNVVNRLWDTLPDRERLIIACDCDCQTELSAWFARVVATEAKMIHEDGEHWENDPESFKHAQFEQPVLA